MIKMNRRSKATGVVLLLMSGLAVLSFNCSQNAFNSAKFLGGDSTSSSSSSTSAQAAAANSPYSQMTGLQAFQSMLNVTGQSATMTAAQQNEYVLRTSALADSNSLASINGPLIIASTSLAGEVCNGLITSESAMAAANRIYFGPVDFTSGVVKTSVEEFLAVAQAMAESYYGRSLSSDETQILTAYYNSFIADPAVTPTATSQTRALYLSLCAAMLSSFDSMTF